MGEELCSEGSPPHPNDECGITLHSMRGPCGGERVYRQAVQEVMCDNCLARFTFTCLVCETLTNLMDQDDDYDEMCGDCAEAHHIAVYRRTR